jgi:hypothetical protein
MKIPKEVAAALRKRTAYAEKLNAADYIVSCFIEENGIEVNTEDYLTGVEMYANPYASEMRIRAAIKAHKENA